MDKTVTLLYVNDEYINLRLFELNFGKKYKIVTATNGLDALKLLEQNPDITIVITDLKMPGMNGLEFVQKAKQQHPETIFLLLTGFEISEEVEKALDKGLLVKYFSKPLDMQDI